MSSSVKRTYTVYFADGTSFDVQTSQGMSAARAKVLDSVVKARGGVVGIVRAGKGFEIVKASVSPDDEAWLASQTVAAEPLPDTLPDDGGMDL